MELPELKDQLATLQAQLAANQSQLALLIAQNTQRQNITSAQIAKVQAQIDGLQGVSWFQSVKDKLIPKE